MRRILARVGLCLIAACAAIAPVVAPSPASGQAASFIREVRIEGAQRIDPATVRSYMTINPGDPFDANRVNDSLKSLYATGLFADVSMRREGQTLVVVLVENPVINRIAFEGNNQLDDDELEAEVQLRSRIVYTRTRVQQDVERIQTAYRRSGRFNVSVEPKVIQLDQNRVNLAFEIDEGTETGISKIVFVGNRKFSDGRLREVILTSESRWWDIFGGNDTYDPDRLNVDRELLRRFYLQNGYADFKVLSAVAELTPDKEDFVITFTIGEGERYRFGRINIEADLRGLDSAALLDQVSSVSGDWYDAEQVEDSISSLTDAVGNLGYAFVDVRPKLNRQPERRLIDVTYSIGEGPKVFIERIDITGNFRTEDKVVRREFRLVEGDAFNTSKIRRSRQRIQNLGFFRKVDVRNVEGSASDRTVIEVDVEEQSTGELTFGLGFSTVDGPLGDISIRERNLLGRGQDLRLSFTGSARSQQIDLGFTEPYFLDRPLAAGFDVFRIQRDQQEESNFDEEELGFNLRMGYSISEELRQSWTYSLRQVEITNVGANASRAVLEDQGENTISEIGQSLLFDKRDNRFLPNSGYFLRLSNRLAGLGGTVDYLRTNLEGGWYYSLFEDVVLSVTGQGGYIFGLEDDRVRLSDRFYVGGTNLRGFAVSGVGPRDLATDDSLGGQKFYVGSVQVRFPLGLPDELGITGRVFSDFGSLWDVSTDSAASFDDDHALRASIGAGIGWVSPFGPIAVDFAVPLLKEDFDDTEAFRVNFGTNF